MDTKSWWLSRLLFLRVGLVRKFEKSFDGGDGSDRLSPMKTASLKIRKDKSVEGVDVHREFTGDDLCQRNATYVPVGFFRNANKSYKGVVFRDCNGNCTYFDRTHGLVYAFEREVWSETIFNFIPEMKSMSIGFPTEKKVKKATKWIDISTGRV